MKYLAVLSAILVVVSALPLGVKPYDSHPVDDIAGNASTRFHSGLIGFGTGTTGGVGGAVWNVWDPFALRSAIGGGNEPRIIIVNGRIDVFPLFVSSPGIHLFSGSRKTIQGLNRNAEIFGGGIRVENQENVIIRNIKISNAISFAPGEQPNGSGGILNQLPGAYSVIDAVDIRNSRYVWVDHCEFSDDPFNAASIPSDRRRHDGLIDITHGANWISISNNIFRNHEHVTLVGNSDSNGAEDSGKLKVTFYYNWYRGVNQRCPRVRFGEVHVLNNLYTDLSFYGIGVGVGASIHAERNMFINTRRGWVSAWNAPWPLGHLLSNNNWFTNSGHDSGIPSNVNWNPSQYYSYTAQAASRVEAYVRANSGPR